MARWTQIYGPAANFTAPIAGALITGFTDTRHWGGGPVILHAHAMFSNISGARSFPSLAPFFDGAGAIPLALGSHINATDQITISLTRILALQPGFHTFELRAFSNPTNTSLVLAQSAALTVIELPIWDDFFHTKQL